MNAYDVEWILVVLTDGKIWAGNYERELTAYATGMTGDCGVGENMVKLFAKEVPEEEFVITMQDNLIAHVSDEHGCCRPTEIWRVNGQYDVGIFLNDLPTDQEWELIRTRIEKFATERPDCVGKSWFSGEIVPIQIKGYKWIRHIIQEEQLDSLEACRELN